MTQILPYVYKVQFADDEGAIIYVLINQQQEEEIKQLRSTLMYIDVWFEDEDQEKLRQERLTRWGKTVRGK